MVILSLKKAATITITIVGKAITFKRKPSKKKQRTNIKKDAMRIKSENFTRGNREKFNIAITILDTSLLLPI